MKFLLVPGNNSLSHVSKCLAVKEALDARGHDCLIAVGRRQSAFLCAMDYRDHAVLPDLQESDGAGFPTMNWFRDPSMIRGCIRAEMNLLDQYRPDRVLGVFRFTLKASTEITGIAFDTLICGCMLPDSKEVLGFSWDTPDLQRQRDHINMFFHSAGEKMSRIRTAFGLTGIRDIREMLIGDRTFLWDFPEFMTVDTDEKTVHVGPISWRGWPGEPIDLQALADTRYPVAIVSFGTCGAGGRLVLRIVKILLDSGFKVVVAAGGCREVLSSLPNHPRVLPLLYAPVHDILPHAALVVSHGGQMTVFEALWYQTPVAVIPFHPEQAHSGICLERIGCGRMLVPSFPFVGNSNVYLDALERMSDEDIRSILMDLVENPEIRSRLAAISTVVKGYNAIDTLVARMEGGTK